MGKYTQDAQQLLRLIGGKENIAAVSHCVTRMRFVLNDPSKADVEAIEAMKVVKGSFTQAGQFQVIIGNAVADFYNDFVKVAGVEGVSKDAVKQAAKKNQNILQKVIAALAEIFAPLIPAIITGGLILGFRNCIDSIYFFENGTKTLCDISQFWSGMDSFLWLIGEAIFHMLPVGICWSVTKKMGTTEMLGIVLGLTLVSGQLLNAYSVAGTAAADIPKWDFGFVKVNMIGYQAQVLPAIMAAFVLVYLERFFRKISPQVISSVVVPFCSLVAAVMAAHFIVGPIGWKIGSAISSVVYAGITGSFKVVFGAIFGFVYAPLVITGLHHIIGAVEAQLIAATGTNFLNPLMSVALMGQGGAVLGYLVLNWKNVKAREICIPSFASTLFGISEPAIFGVNLRYRFPLIGGCIGGAAAGAYVYFSKLTALGFGTTALPGMAIANPANYGYINYIVAHVIALAIGFVATAIIGKMWTTVNKAETIEEETNSTDDGKKAEAKDVVESIFYAPAEGEVKPISESSDQTFSKKILGDGVVVFPENGFVMSPCNAKVKLVYPTGHAVGLETEDGTVILIHCGIDTVNMKGEGFEVLVKEGQQVAAGDILVKFDKELVESKGYSSEILVVFTEVPTGNVLKINEQIPADRVIAEIEK